MCILPNISLPNDVSSALAVNKGRKIYVCGFWPHLLDKQNPDRDCYMTENIANGGAWKKIATRQFANGGSSYALVGSLLLATNGQFSDSKKNLFEFLDLSVEDSSWETIELGMPYLPDDHHMIDSCMIAINDTAFILIGGRTYKEESWLFAGSLTQIYNFQTGEWTRMPDLNPGRSDHACMRYLDGVLLAGGVTQANVGGGGMVKRDVNFFNLTSSTWQDFPPLNYYRSDHILVPVDGIPTVIGDIRAQYSEQFVDGSWQPWLEHWPAIQMSAVQVPSDEFHC